MPLPAALQARLFKRGILKTRSDPQPDEEIIAEDYDDHPMTLAEDAGQAIGSTTQSTSTLPRTFTDYKSAPGCPNKWNIFHECTSFCFAHWGEGIHEPNPSDEIKRLKMLRKYPLPKNWNELYDAGTGRYFYWNTSTDEVSWLPPLHPKAKISFSSAKLREIRKGKENDEPHDIDIDELMDEDIDDIDKHVVEKHRVKRSDVYRSRGSGTSSSGGRSKKSNELDPMDPASYSDTPRGNWSTGLERKGEAKTGADTTASGPLYQMRPYPSPGAVLRANAEIQSRDVPKK